MLVKPSVLCSIPPEVLEDIALELVLADPIGPPKNLLRLAQTCKHIHETLTSNALRARIYNATFDSSASRRRLGTRAHRSKNLARQLQVNHGALALIRSGDIYVATIEHLLWRAFLMLLDNDGKNHVQLAAAGLDDFVERFILERLMEDADDGWPVDNTVNSLALWVFSMMITEGASCFSLAYAASHHHSPPSSAEKLNQDHYRRQKIVDLVLPYVSLPFRVRLSLSPRDFVLLLIPLIQVC